MNHIITISREFGSGGRTVGKKVAEQLGIPCYDSELIQKIAEESGFAENYVKEAGEYTPGGFRHQQLPVQHRRVVPPDGADRHHVRVG